MLKVIKGGVEAVVEDWPGRLGYLDNGMAASGAFDPVALGLANVVVGNASGEAGVEIAGGYFEGRFERDGVICITGTDMNPTVNGQPVSMWEALKVNEGDEIKFSHFGEFGFRTYIAVAGGIDVPVYLGSKSTCLFGSYGGFEGRTLAAGDVLEAGPSVASLSSLIGRKIRHDKRPALGREFTLRAIPGPNAAPDYVTEAGMDLIAGRPWKVLFSTNRSACRLEEIPDPEAFFVRKSGGVAGSHASNVLDHAYAIPGSMNVCGNTPIILIADGPTLGGYLNCLQIIWADLWMAGQCTPGRDFMRFTYVTQEEAIEARKAVRQWLSEESLA